MCVFEQNSRENRRIQVYFDRQLYSCIASGSSDYFDDFIEPDGMNDIVHPIGCAYIVYFAIPIAPKSVTLKTMDGFISVSRAYLTRFDMSMLSIVVAVGICFCMRVCVNCVHVLAEAKNSRNS